MATTYKVVSGDTASQIAAKYGTTVTALQQANPQYSQFVSNPNYIQAGWTLNIPTTTATAGSNAPTNASQLTSLTQQLAEAQKKLTTISSQLSTAKEAGYVPGTESGKAEIKYTPEGEIIPYKVAYPESNLPKTTDTVAYTQGIQNEVMQARTQLESAYQKQIEDLRAQQEAAQKKIETITSQQKDLLETDIKTLLQPWQADLEKAERERLKVEENYFANQKSVAELEQLLNRALTDIQSAEAVTGLSSIRSPRIAQIRQDYEARAGVIQAVMAARNNQIAVATNLIDRSISAITNDINAQLTYYQNLYNFYEKQRTEEGNNLIQLSQTERQYINAKIGLLENDLSQAQATANYIKELMINPQTAQAIEGAGVKLTDSVETINKKLADYAYTQEVANTANQLVSQGLTQLLPGQKAPAGAQTITIKDSKGKETQWYATPTETTISEATFKSPLTGANLATRIEQEINNLYQGQYGTTGAREKVIQALSNEFPGQEKTISSMIYSRLPDGYETQIKGYAPSLEEIKRQTKEIFKQYKDAGWTREQIEKQWKADNGNASELSPLAKEALDELFPKEKSWWQFWK